MGNLLIERVELYVVKKVVEQTALQPPPVPITSQITEGVNSLTIDWSDGIAIVFRKVRGMHPVINVEAHRNGHNVTLAMQDLGLRSGSGRRELARELGAIEKYADVVWPNRLLEACVTAQMYASRREPMQVITGSRPSTPVKYLLYPVLPEGQTTMLYGEKATNKSTLARLFAVCCLLPWQDNPMGLGVPEHPVRSLIMDYEDDRDNYERCLSQIVQAYGLGAVDISYYRSDTPIEDDSEHIQNLLYESGANLLIIDSKNAAVGGGRDLNKGDTGSAFFNALRPLRAKEGKLTTLILDHQSKDEETKRHKPFGSRVFGDRARYIWEVRRAMDEGDDNPVTYLGMWLNWTNLSRGVKPLGFSLQWAEDDRTLEIEQYPVSKVADFSDKLSASTRILRSLKRGYLSIKQISDETGLKPPSITARLHELVKKGQVENMGGVWGLSVKENL